MTYTGSLKPYLWFLIISVFGVIFFAPEGKLGDKYVAVTLDGLSVAPLVIGGILIGLCGSSYKRFILYAIPLALCLSFCLNKFIDEPRVLEYTHGARTLAPIYYYAEFHSALLLAHASSFTKAVLCKLYRRWRARQVD